MTLRAVLVGCGGMGNNWARILLPRQDLDIVGLVDVAPAAAAALKDRHNLDVPTFATLENALATLSVGVVLDTAVPETRRHIAGTALQHGCHVLSEKPLATSVAQAQELLAIAESAGRTHAVMQNRRYLAGTRGVRQLVADGVVGEVGMICADFFLGAHFGGFRDEMANVLLAGYGHPYLRPSPLHVWLRRNERLLRRVQRAGFLVSRQRLGIGDLRDGWRRQIFATAAHGPPKPKMHGPPGEAQWRIVGSLGTVIWDGTDAPPYAEVVAADDGFMRPCRRIETGVAWQGPHGHAGCLGRNGHRARQ